MAWIAPGLESWDSGTTVVGLIFTDGVLLAADSRASVYSKEDGKLLRFRDDVEKIFRIARNVGCAGAGLSSEVDDTIGRISHAGRGIVTYVSRKLARLKEELSRGPAIEADFLLAGYDREGPHLHLIRGDRTTSNSEDITPYAAIGSGAEHALCVLEFEYWPDLMDFYSASMAGARAIEVDKRFDKHTGGKINVWVFTEGHKHTFVMQPLKKTYKEWEMVDYQIEETISVLGNTL